MKAGLIAVAALSAVVSAQPHNVHRHHHAQRDVVVETDVVTDIAYVTATAAAAVVYVDQQGAVIDSPQAQPTEAPAAPAYTPPAVESSAAPAPAAFTPLPAPNPPAYSAPAPVYSAPAYSAPAYSAPASSAAASAPASSSGSSSSGSSSSSSGLGITYSPYNADQSCKSSSQVQSDVSALSGYGTIRLYGVDCNQVSNVLAALPSGWKIFAGIYDVNNVASELQTLISAVGDKWSVIDTVAIGNEAVNSGQFSVGQVTAAVSAARGILGATGFKGSIVTVDTFTAILANPELCEISDYAAANCHAFFDSGTTASEAGSFVLSQAQRVSQACGGKNTVITESGWPSSGSSNGAAVPSPENQKAAISALQSTFSSNLILFNAYNDLWKADNAGTFGTEKYWGIHGNCPSS